MKNQYVTVFVTALLLAFFTMPAAADEAGLSVEFSDNEVALIRAYYKDQAGNDSSKGNGKNGNAKNKSHKSLPPGIAMNLKRGKTLPPGIAKQGLPGALAHQLPASPRGFERIEVGGKVLLVEVATQVIHDVLEDLILN